MPEKQHVAMQFGNSDLVNEYADHTRVVSRAHRNLCTLGYALSLQGARCAEARIIAWRASAPSNGDKNDQSPAADKSG